VGTGDILLMVALHVMDYHLVKEGGGEEMLLGLQLLN